MLAAQPWAYTAVLAGVFAVLGWRLPLGRPADAALAAAWLLLAAVGIVLAGIDVRVNRLPRPIIAGAVPTRRYVQRRATSSRRVQPLHVRAAAGVRWSGQVGNCRTWALRGPHSRCSKLHPRKPRMASPTTFCVGPEPVCSY
jgi:hypothetical protein